MNDKLFPPIDKQLKLVFEANFISDVDRLGRPTLVVRTYVRPTFQNLAKQISNANNVYYWRDCGSGQVDHWWHFYWISFLIGNHFQSCLSYAVYPKLWPETRWYCSDKLTQVLDSCSHSYGRWSTCWTIGRNQWIEEMHLRIEVERRKNKYVKIRCICSL